jgi:hypothetical protein
MSSADGKTFVNKVPVVGNTSPAGPALASFNNKLYLAWTGTDKAGDLNVMSSPDGETFEVQNKKTLGDTGRSGPALASFNNKLYLGWTGTDAKGDLNVSSSTGF